MTPSEDRGRWFRRASFVVPTLRTWVVAVVVIGITATVCMLSVHSFLSVTEPIGAGILVVEGWMPDAVIPQLVRTLTAGDYVAVVTTGGAVQQGTYLHEFETFAEIMAKSLEQRISDIPVHAVPAPHVQVDRTFASALALKDWLKTSEFSSLRRFDVASDGPHARRSRLLFALALGDTFDVGIIAMPPSDHDPSTWWESSAGVRAVMGETVAYAYAKVLFWPAPVDPTSQ